MILGIFNNWVELAFFIFCLILLCFLLGFLDALWEQHQKEKEKQKREKAMSEIHQPGS